MTTLYLEKTLYCAIALEGFLILVLVTVQFNLSILGELDRVSTMVESNTCILCNL